MSLSKLIFFVITLYCFVFIATAYSLSLPKKEYHEKAPKKIIADHFERGLKKEKVLENDYFKVVIEKNDVYFYKKIGSDAGRKINLASYFTLVEPEYVLGEVLKSSDPWGRTNGVVCVVDKLGFHCLNLVMVISPVDILFGKSFSKEWSLFGKEVFSLYAFPNSVEQKVYLYLVASDLETFKIEFYPQQNIKRVCLPNQKEICEPSKIIGSYQLKQTDLKLPIKKNEYVWEDAKYELPWSNSYENDYTWEDKFKKKKFTKDLLIKVPKIEKILEGDTFELGELEFNQFIHGYDSKDNWIMPTPLFTIHQQGSKFYYRCLNKDPVESNGCLPISKKRHYLLTIQDKHMLIAEPNPRHYSYGNFYYLDYRGEIYGKSQGNCDFEKKSPDGKIFSICQYDRPLSRYIEVLSPPKDFYQAKPPIEKYEDLFAEKIIPSPKGIIVISRLKVGEGYVKELFLARYLLKPVPVYIQGYTKWKQ